MIAAWWETTHPRLTAVLFLLNTAWLVFVNLMIGPVLLVSILAAVNFLSFSINVCCIWHKRRLADHDH